jgi:hypothetical protein
LGFRVQTRRFGLAFRLSFKLSFRLEARRAAIPPKDRRNRRRF